MQTSLMKFQEMALQERKESLKQINVTRHAQEKTAQTALY
jgi:hypothetical protein